MRHRSSRNPSPASILSCSSLHDHHASVSHFSILELLHRLCHSFLCHWEFFDLGLDVMLGRELQHFLQAKSSGACAANHTETIDNKSQHRNWQWRWRYRQRKNLGEGFQNRRISASSSERSVSCYTSHLQVQVGQEARRDDQVVQFLHSLEFVNALGRMELSGAETNGFFLL
jgi:hypothetical protein